MGISASKRSVDITQAKSKDDSKLEPKPVEVIEAKEKDASFSESPEKKAAQTEEVQETPAKVRA